VNSDCFLVSFEFNDKNDIPSVDFDRTTLKPVFRHISYQKSVPGFYGPFHRESRKRQWAFHQRERGRSWGRSRGNEKRRAWLSMAWPPPPQVTKRQQPLANWEMREYRASRCKGPVCIDGAALPKQVRGSLWEELTSRMMKSDCVFENNRRIKWQIQSCHFPWLCFLRLRKTLRSADSKPQPSISFDS